ncbi:MAG: hypothetical protein RIS35_2709 [Pseudomonadota bacterium]
MKVGRVPVTFFVLFIPFGAALFFLRRVAPKEEYTDAVTGKRMAGIRWGQIYLGSIPFVVIQLIMVEIIIAYPNLVTTGLGKQTQADTPVDPLKGLSKD